MPDKKDKKMWGGRFSEDTDQLVGDFNASVDFDKKLYRYDIQGSMAHANMLAQVGILSEKERDQIVQGLSAIQQEIEQGQFVWDTKLEDVHMNIEAKLTEKVGEVGKKLHTGRSRNDQVATDFRLYVRDAIDELSQLITKVQSTLINKAKVEYNNIMPGMTHLQPAQPVTIGFYLMAWNEMFERDYQRLKDCRIRVNVSPLGSGALAGTTFPIDRESTAQALGFTVPASNAMDAVSDRDFAIEFAACASIIMMHLSRCCEELIIWSSAPYQFVELPDRFCTGSSMMPQKKNPDVPELIRGKTGRVFGHLLSLLTLMKAQPLAYNKDNQEDKEPIFDTVETLQQCLSLFDSILSAIKFNHANLKQAVEQGYVTATDLADYLVNKGVPFRDAHECVGKAVFLCIKRDCQLHELPLAEFKKLSDMIDETVYDILTPEGSVAARNHFGGTAPEVVAKAIDIAEKALLNR